jgi:tripartite-type tricarboxylate transporter receptor subunit TctC
VIALLNSYAARLLAGADAAVPDELRSLADDLAETARALAGGELKAMWQSLGAEPGGQPPEEMARFVDTEIRKWAKVVKDSGAKLD